VNSALAAGNAVDLTDPAPHRARSARKILARFMIVLTIFNS
jgi:hypothetical protein